MKTATLGNATRTVGKMFFGLALLAVAIAAGFGGTALLVYHQLGGSTKPADVRTADRAKPERKALPAPAPATNNVPTDLAQTRRVAAGPADLPSYTYADNNGGQPSQLARGQKPVAPPALEAAPRANAVPPVSTGLNDLESQYIVDSRTGRVIGIDGTAGAQREAEEMQRRLVAAPRAVAVQTPMPEVRVASAVTLADQSSYRGAQPGTITVPGAQYIPVRRAMPVVAEDRTNDANNFNVAAYLADDRNRPALRALPVDAPSAKTAARSSHVFRLPDGTRAVVPD